MVAAFNPHSSHQFFIPTNIKTIPSLLSLIFNLHTHTKNCNFFFSTFRFYLFVWHTCTEFTGNALQSRVHLYSLSHCVKIIYTLYFFFFFWCCSFTILYNTLNSNSVFSCVSIHFELMFSFNTSKQDAIHSSPFSKIQFFFPLPFRIIERC